MSTGLGYELAGRDRDRSAVGAEDDQPAAGSQALGQLGERFGRRGRADNDIGAAHLAQ